MYDEEIDRFIALGLWSVLKIDEPRRMSGELYTLVATLFRDYATVYVNISCAG